MSYEETECTPWDCMCGHYDNPYDNYYYSHKLNPALQYMFWTEEWKTQTWEIHKSCQELGQTTYTDEYVRGYLDAVSPLFPTGDINNITEEGIMDYTISDDFNEFSNIVDDEIDRIFSNHASP